MGVKEVEFGTWTPCQPTGGGGGGVKVGCEVAVVTGDDPCPCPRPSPGPCPCPVRAAESSLRNGKGESRPSIVGG